MIYWREPIPQKLRSFCRTKEPKYSNVFLFIFVLLPLYLIRWLQEKDLGSLEPLLAALYITGFCMLIGYLQQIFASRGRIVKMREHHIYIADLGLINGCNMKYNELEGYEFSNYISGTKRYDLLTLFKKEGGSEEILLSPNLDVQKVKNYLDIHLNL